MQIKNLIIMKLFSVVFLSIVMHLEPVMGENRVIRLGGYRWVSIDGNPYVRFTRGGYDSHSLSQLHSDDFISQKIRNGQTQDYPKTITNPLSLNKQDLLYPRFPVDKGKLDAKMDVKRTNYIRLAKRGEGYFIEPKMSQDQVHDYPPVLAMKEDILYPMFPSQKRSLDQKTDMKRTNYIRLAEREINLTK